MSSGMNTEQAKEYAKTMTYREAVSNIRYAKGIKYRKATMIKLHELAEIADRLDRKTEPQTDNGIGCSRCEGRFDCYDRDMPHAVHCNNYGKITDEPQTEEWYTFQDEQEYNARHGKE